MFAIEKIGARPFYCIKSVKSNGTNPVDFKRYRTLEAAMQAAENLNIKISAVGNYYEIIHTAREMEG